MSILNANLDAPSALLTPLTAVSTNPTTSVGQDVKHWTMGTLQVTGVWTGTLAISAYIESTSNWVVIPILDSDGKPISRITTNGLYRIQLAGFTQFRIRAEPTSGAVTVTARLSRGQATPVDSAVENSPAMALHTAADANAYGTGFNVEQFNMLTLQVAGTWTGKVRVQGQIKSTSDYVFLPMYDINGILVPDGKVTANGIYKVPAGGYVTMRTRVEPASGAVDVVGRLSKGILPAEPSKTRQVLVGSMLQQVVPAGTTVNALLSNTDLTPYAFIYAAARADAPGAFTVDYVPTNWPGGTFGSPDGYRNLLTVDAGVGRGIGEWKEVVTPGCYFSISNNDVVEHTYDVWVYGVR